MARPIACQAHRAELAAALAELAEAAGLALAVASPVRIARYNAAQANLTATLHAGWRCPDCFDKVNTAKELSLFPEY